MSLESQLRYADFLYNAGDYKTLQEVATQLTKYANSNLRVYRYIGYAALETKDYPAGITALNKFISQAGDKRVLPNDYDALGKLQLANGDSTGIQNLRKAYQMDTTRADVFLVIANNARTKRQYLSAANAYQDYFDKSHKGSLTDHFYQATAYFSAFNPNDAKSDSTLLTKADSAFSFVNKKAANPVGQAVLYRGYIADYKDNDRNNIKGLAKPYYEQFITITSVKPTPTDQDKKDMAAAYVYLGTYYKYKEKDDAKALENYTKAQALDPTNKQVVAYFAPKPATKSK